MLGFPSASPKCRHRQIPYLPDTYRGTWPGTLPKGIFKIVHKGGLINWPLISLHLGPTDKKCPPPHDRQMAVHYRAVQTQICEKFPCFMSRTAVHIESSCVNMEHCTRGALACSAAAMLLPESHPYIVMRPYELTGLKVTFYVVVALSAHTHTHTHMHTHSTAQHSQTVVVVIPLQYEVLA